MTVTERTEYAIFAKRPGSSRFTKISAVFNNEELTRRRLVMFRERAGLPTSWRHGWDFTMRSRKVRIETGDWR